MPSLISILLLLLGHILGDFVFQSNHMVHKKYQSFLGVFEHAALVTLFTLILLIPYLSHPSAWVLLGVLAMTHTAQDELKVSYQKAQKKTQFWPYALDQMVHLLVLFGLAFWLDQITPSFLWPEEWIASLLILTLPFVFHVSAHEWKKKSKGNLQYSRPYLYLFCWGAGLLSLAWTIFLLFFT